MKMMLTKLMDINNVANNCCGLSNNRLTDFSAGLSLSRRAARCSAFKEKNATSEPAKRAERNSKAIKISPMKNTELKGRLESIILSKCLGKGSASII
jgi:hypothetical protein